MNKQNQMNNKQNKMTKEECFVKLEESLRKSIITKAQIQIFITSLLKKKINYLLLTIAY